MGKRGAALWATLVMVGRAASADVTQTPEVPVADRLLCPAEAGDASIALGPGGGGLVVWLDSRFYSSKSTAMAARIDANGVLLDPVGIYLGPASVVGHPTAAFDGSHYLVAWSNESGTSVDTGVYAARIAMDGTLVDTTPITIAALGNVPAVAASSGQFVVTWQVQNQQVLATRVGDDGSILDSTPLVLGSGSFIPNGPSAIFDGTNYVAVWSGAGIQAARLSPSGTVIAPGQVDLVAQIIGFQPSPAIVFNGSEYLVAWDAGGLQQMRVSSAMVPLESPMSFYGAGAPPEVAFDGTHYTIAVEEDTPSSPGRIELVTATTADAYQGVAQYTLPGPADFGRARLVYNGTQLLLGFLSDGVVGGARIANDGTILDATPLTWSQTKSDQYNPRIAFDGADQYLVAWTDSRDLGQRTSIVVGRVDESGGLDGSGIPVTSNIEHGGKTGHVAVARPAAPGSTALVAWDDSPGRLHAARVDGSGQVLDPGGFIVFDNTTLDDNGSSLVMGCVDTTCLVVWADQSFNIRGVRVGLDGTVLDSTPLALGSGLSPRVTASNGTFLVTGGNPVMVPETGAPLPIQLPSSIGLGSWSVDWDGTQFLMVWSEMVGQKFQLRSVRLDANGTQIGQPAQLATLDASVFVNVVHDGSQWIVVWYPFLFVDADSIFISRIAKDGQIRDPGGIPLSTGTGVSAFASGSDGRFVMLRQVTTEPTPDRGTYAVASWITINGAGNGAGGSSGGCCRTDGGGSGTLVVAMFVAVTLRRARSRYLIRRA
jgi:hypothetical protein